MAYIYFFKNDGKCSYMKKELTEFIPRYLKGPVIHRGEKIKFFGVLDWIYREKEGANLEHIKELGVNYIQSLNELPRNAGVYITGYDLDLDDFNTIRQKEIPYIEHPCPWIKQLRNQLLNADTKTHQLVLMIHEQHMVYDCYKSQFPGDIIIINRQNYREKIAKQKNSKPLQLLVYATFREKDVLQVIDHINREHCDKNNILDGYKRTLCGWTKQGLLEEIDDAIGQHDLDEIWIICSSEHDTSTQSVIMQIEENDTGYRIIKSDDDLPEHIYNLNIGVLYAPIPLPGKLYHLDTKIKNHYNTTQHSSLTMEAGTVETT